MDNTRTAQETPEEKKAREDREKTTNPNQPEPQNQGGVVNR